MVTRDEFKPIEDMKGENVLSSTLGEEFTGTVMKTSQREDKIKYFIQLDPMRWTIISYRMAKSLTTSSHLHILFDILKGLGLQEDTEVLVGKKVKWIKKEMNIGFPRHFPKEIL